MAGQTGGNEEGDYCEDIHGNEHGKLRCSGARLQWRHLFANCLNDDDGSIYVWEVSVARRVLITLLRSSTHVLYCSEPEKVGWGAETTIEELPMNWRGMTITSIFHMPTVMLGIVIALAILIKTFVVPNSKHSTHTSSAVPRASNMQDARQKQR